MDVSHFYIAYGPTILTLSLFSGNFLVMASTCAVTIGLTRGGVNAPWQSGSILAPMIIGLIGWIGFIVYDAFVATHPLVGAIWLYNNFTCL